MGGAALLGLLTLAAAAAPPRRAAAPDDVARAAGRVDALVTAARRTRAAIAPLLDELVAARDSYAWESDADRARTRRTTLRGRLVTLAAALNGQLADIGVEIHRFTEDHGLEALQSFADSRTPSRPEYMAFIRAQTFSSQARPFLAAVDAGLRQEQEAWLRFEGLDRERRAFRKALWAFGAAFLAVLAIVIVGFRGPARRGGRRRRRDVIDVRPE